MVNVSITQVDLKRTIFDKLAPRWAAYYPQDVLTLDGSLELVTNKLVRLDNGADTDAPLLPFYYRLPPNPPKNHVGSNPPMQKFYPATSVKLRLLVPRTIVTRARHRLMSSLDTEHDEAFSGSMSDSDNGMSEEDSQVRVSGMTHLSTGS